MNIRLLTQEDLPLLREFWIQHWGTDFVIAHSASIRYDEVELEMNLQSLIL